MEVREELRERFERTMDLPAFLGQRGFEPGARPGARGGQTAQAAAQASRVTSLIAWA
jgi:hypothetical protein